MKTLQKKQHGFTLIELMVVVAIIGIIASIAVPAYNDYMTKAKWAKVIHGMRALKLAVENCLADTNAAFDQCDEINNGKVDAYGITTYATETEEFSSITIAPNTAAIKIVGKAPLDNCILTMSPYYSTVTNVIGWHYFVTGGGTASSDKCKAYVKDSSTSG